MCGIFGVIGAQDAALKVVEGLKRLEYRGYDSAGVATVENGVVHTRREAGKISRLEDLLKQQPLGHGDIAIGHTRWATHGEPNNRNAHPHGNDTCAVVHNGIIENYIEIRAELGSKGYTFQSDTDTEVIPALISTEIAGGAQALDAVLRTIHRVKGTFAIGMVLTSDPDTIIATRRGSPLLVGLTDDATYLGSDAIALAPFTNRIVYLENDDVAVLKNTGVSIFNREGKAVTRPVKTVDVSGAMAEKDGYRHFMLKEIHQQPAVFGQTLSAYLSADHKAVAFPDLPFDLGKIESISLVACGTSYHAGLVAKYWVEELAGIPVSVDVASEFRYRNPPLKKGGLSIFISQSGETADTLAALEYSRGAGQHVLSIVNVPTSSMARASDVVLQTRAGAEIGVASTKAFTTQLALLALLAVETGFKNGSLTAQRYGELLQSLIEVPAKMITLLDQEPEIARIADDFTPARSSLFLARGNLFPIALEGALKLKEISYIHAEGYAAGEMKHGPIALIDEAVPVVTLASGTPLFEKTLSNMKEVEARKGRVYLFADAAAAKAAGPVSGATFVMPDAAPFVHPILQSIPMQLLAYHVAVLRGTDVDQPRNLAKSVTVE